MKKINKKGFTIVELVIVIAVIAILSAVLIPTFSNLIRKAQVSADTQLAKNLNTALAMADAEGKELDDFSDILQVLHDGGYVIANLNPTADDNWFAWDKETNQILYLNSNFEVVYQNTEPSSDKSKWIVGVGTSEDRETVIAAGLIAYFAPNNNEDLNDYIGEILANPSNEPQTIVFGGNLDFDNNPLYTITGKDTDLTFDLAGSTLGGTVLQETAPIFVKEGNLTLKNGTFTAEGKHLSDDGSGNILTSSVQYGQHGNAPENTGTLKVENMTFDTQATAVRVYFGTAEVKDTVMNISGGQSVYAGAGAKITLSNVTANVKNYRNIFASSYAGEGFEKVTAEVLIKNGTYNMYSDGSNYNINLYYGAKVTIEDGTFGAYTANGDASNKMFYINSGTLVISGGTFNGKKYDQLTKAEWVSLCDSISESNIQISNGVVTITK